MSRARTAAKVTSKRNKKGEAIIKEGYVGKPKGSRQIAWERGLHKPESEGKMHGKKIDPENETADPSLSLPHVLSNCWDFAHEKTALTRLFESRGQILRMCVKGHPELAGVLHGAAHVQCHDLEKHAEWVSVTRTP